VETLPAGCLESPLAHTARLLASEIVTNSVRHAGAGEHDVVGFEIVLSPASVRVEVTDRGPGFVPDASAPRPDEVGGRGLFLVDQMADRWGTADGGTRVWFELDRAAR
jgi:serine/threonine-protein kinase RsbW